MYLSILVAYAYNEDVAMCMRCKFDLIMSDGIYNNNK